MAYVGSLFWDGVEVVGFVAVCAIVTVAALAAFEGAGAAGRRAARWFSKDHQGR